MRRILAIIVLAAILVLAISVPALADSSDPPNAFGQDQAWLAKVVKQYAQDYGIKGGYGNIYNAPMRWAIWWGTIPYDNGGEYVASLKEDASY